MLGVRRHHMHLKLTFQIGQKKDDIELLKRVGADFLNWDIGLDIASSFENGQCMFEFLASGSKEMVNAALTEKMKQLGAKWTLTELG
jgi:hypothetical protein